jgi:hypothetical protein
MYVKVYELTTDNAMCADMKELLAPRPAGYVPYDMRENGCERERLDAIDALNRAVRYAVKHKIEVPFAKEFVNGLYGVSSLQFSDRKGDPDPRDVDNSGDENVKDDSRDIFVTVNSDHVSPQTMNEIAKLIAVLSDTDRDIHVNVI